MPNPFIWYELMTTDAPAAIKFYSHVVGWQAEAMSGSGMDYTVVQAQGFGIGGIMAQPAHMAGQNVPPFWAGYIYAADVDKAAESVAKGGGIVHREPWTIQGAGRIAVVADPGGAVFNIMTPDGQPPANEPAWDAPGMVGWRELYASDLEQALAFYQAQFGWTKDETHDMGPMGPYHLFTSAKNQSGGMMKRPPQVPASFWQFYFIVDDIDTAAKRVADQGGQVLMGPHQVPGGGWIVQAMDPQGGAFALTGPRPQVA